MDRANAETGKDIGGKRGMIASLASISLVMSLGNSMLIPVLPIIEKQLKRVYSLRCIRLWQLFFIPIAGYMSDRMGRKKVIIPSLLLAAIGGA
ncbi:MFS transporter [Parageobacillus toebii]|uniref:MFS family permease n=1 Tax=Parageobacillus toebii NBRC 107807 TaxID=1223503 RepID=A0AA89NID8_9BACL|nr:MFS transporter [Parageobacillus toebii]MBB3868158.1 MFS family permease [Parageobacillus toebii NBRC 107807]